MDAWAFAVSLVVSALFITSGVAKLRADSFISTLADYRLLTPHLVVRVARLLPWVEILLGAILLTGAVQVGALFGAAALLAVFGTGVAVNLIRGRRIDCGCRGVRTEITWRIVATNLCLAAACVVTAAAGPRAAVVPALLGMKKDLTSSDAIGLLMIVVIGVVATRLVMVGSALFGASSRMDALHADRLIR